MAMRAFTYGSNSATATTGLTVVGATSLNMGVPAAAPSANIELLRCWVGQAANATSAQQRIQLAQAVSAFPTTAVSVTPAKLALADPNVSVLAGATTIAAGKVGINVATETGSKTLIWDDTFNVLNGYLKVPTPPETEIFPAGLANGWTLWFPTAPTTLTGWNWGQNYREI
jgi:hypothetical protein